MYKRILVSIDGNDGSDAALDGAINLARVTNAKLRILHVIECELPFTSWELVCIDASTVINALHDGATRLLKKAALKAHAAGVQADTQMMEVDDTRIAEKIVAAAQQFKADLIVVGSHGRSGISRYLLGSVSDGLVRTAPVPVLVVRKSGAEATTGEEPSKIRPYAVAS